MLRVNSRFQPFRFYLTALDTRAGRQEAARGGIRRTIINAIMRMLIPERAPEEDNVGDVDVAKRSLRSPQATWKEGATCRRFVVVTVAVNHR